jgi:hypothetical protein
MVDSRTMKITSAQKTILIIGGIIVGGIFLFKISSGFNQAENQVGSGVSTGVTIASVGATLGGLAWLFLL